MTVRAAASPVAAVVLVLVLGARAAKAPVTAAEPEATTGAARARFSMHCYWIGEATVGRVDGVVRTRIGHFDGDEIVEVEYDPSVTSTARIASALAAAGSLDEVLPADCGQPRFVPAKHTLRTSHPALYWLDLDELQALQLNSWAFFGGAMPDVLDEGQKERWRQLAARLRSGDRPEHLDPDRSRAGRRRDAYRAELVSWLAGHGRRSQR